MKIFDITKDKLPTSCPECHDQNLRYDKTTAFHDTEYREYACLKCGWSEIYDMGPSLSAAMSVGHFPDNKNCFETITETTVSSLGNVSKGMANMCEGEPLIVKNEKLNKDPTLHFVEIFSQRLQNAKRYALIACCELVLAVVMPIVLFFAGFSRRFILITGMVFVVSMGSFFFLLFNAFRCPQCRHFIGTTVMNFCPHCGILVRKEGGHEKKQ